MFLHITDFIQLDDYQLQLTFNNGVVKQVNLLQELYGKIFEPLKTISFFRKVTLNPDTQTIEWPNGADFAPEFLFELGQTIDEVTEKTALFTHGS